MVLHGDCLEVLRSLEENSVDSIVTDPPYGWRFMGKAWDGADIEKMAKKCGDANRGPKMMADGRIRQPRELPAEAAGTYDLSLTGNQAFQEFSREWAKEAFRVLKPGGHMLVFCGPRTYHRMASGVEDAGFEIRDQIQWLFGSGFPKSLNIGKSLPDWQGFGTALKPANEPIVLARKPLSEKTVAANVLKWGTGGLNIDASRITAPGQTICQQRSDDADELVSRSASLLHSQLSRSKTCACNTTPTIQPQGRFPANLILSHSFYCTDLQCDIECAIQMLDEQAGYLHGAGNKDTRKAGTGEKSSSVTKAFGAENGPPTVIHDRGGSASRFFYCAKISTRERNAGCEGMEDKTLAMSGGAKAAAERGEEYTGNSGMNRTRVVKNSHPTVKPKKLMAYLIKLVTPPGGIVLDPFMGSGSTGIAAKENGFKFIGIEKEQDYFEIAKKRIEYAECLS